MQCTPPKMCAALMFLYICCMFFEYMTLKKNRTRPKHLELVQQKKSNPTKENYIAIITVSYHLHYAHIHPQQFWPASIYSVCRDSCKPFYDHGEQFCGNGDSGCSSPASKTR